MKRHFLIGMILFQVSCITSQDNKIKDNNISIVESTQERKVYDFLLYDSVRLNCLFSPSLDIDSLTILIGFPDTIIKYKDETAFYEEPFSIVNYKNIFFRLFDNNQVNFSRMTLQNTDYSICYKKNTFNRNTTLDSIALKFSNSYENRDTINLNGNEKLVAIRFNISPKASSENWIMLFSNERLKYFHYFDGND